MDSFYEDIAKLLLDLRDSFALAWPDPILNYPDILIACSNSEAIGCD